jgi:hypothetical protein
MLDLKLVSKNTKRSETQELEGLMTIILICSSIWNTFVHLCKLEVYVI